MQLVLQAVPRRREQAAMEALSGSASLDDFVSKIEAADWAGCDARAFARAAAEKLVTLSKAEKYRNDTAGEKARVAGIYDLAKRASSRAAARAEWIEVAELLGLTPAEVRDSGKPESLPATVSPILGRQISVQCVL